MKSSKILWRYEEGNTVYFNSRRILEGECGPLDENSEAGSGDGSIITAGTHGDENEER